MYPDKKEFARYGVPRPDFRERFWRGRIRSMPPIGTPDWLPWLGRAWREHDITMAINRIEPIAPPLLPLLEKLKPGKICFVTWGET